MFTPLVSLDLDISSIIELQQKGFLYVEDLLNSSGLIFKILKFLNRLVFLKHFKKSIHLLENCEKFNLNRSDLEKKLKAPEMLALDVWQVLMHTVTLTFNFFNILYLTIIVNTINIYIIQNESQQESISICCSELESILENGVQCGSITELSGAPFTGKTQIW